ncbi:MAG: hypothetical protein K9J37_07735 [Saprospiraceae bacterium]|nr:hypothetical protein [Saprospiraceae bacterium]MCF8249788.1 hypothetical protein [Saprospiraceae bacterium]MCF8279273.1 hypothetical protein [Bacteroidales bacterium]MCF8313461.1 hypothetical protein [Saprospiraceae bacterium]MCF8442174.1 hypothetical protein [Saprospiraceae bacterium]
MFFAVQQQKKLTKKKRLNEFYPKDGRSETRVEKGQIKDGFEMALVTYRIVAAFEIFTLGGLLLVALFQLVGIWIVLFIN